MAVKSKKTAEGKDSKSYSSLQDWKSVHFPALIEQEKEIALADDPTAAGTAAAADIVRKVGDVQILHWLARS